MTTNFFQTLAAIQTDWVITVKTTENNMTVSVLLSNDKVGDNARKIIPPMLFRGTPQELDEGFFAAFNKPAQQTTALFANMEHYLKQLEEAKKQSRMEQDKKENEKKQAEDRKKKYEALMKKVTELETQEKFGEAITQLPKAEDFPEQKEDITARQEQLWKKKNEKENALFH